MLSFQSDRAIVAQGRGPTGVAGDVSTAQLNAAIAALKGGVAAPGDTLAELYALILLRATLDSPAFINNPTAPTQSVGNNSTKLANTAYADRVGTNLAAVTQPLDAILSALSLLSPTVSGVPLFTAGVASALTFDTDTLLAANSDTRIASQKAVKAYVDALAAIVSGALVFKGAWDASAGTFPGGGTAKIGYFYKVSVAGTVNGVAFTVGDDIYAVTDNASTTVYAANWLKIEGSITSAEVIAALGFTPQTSDATLTAFAALTIAADKLVYGTGADAFATTDFTAFARTLLDDANQAAMRTTLGLVPGTDVQAFDADLAALAANSTDGFWAHTGAGTGSARTLTEPAAGITISNPAGIAGNPTFALANDLSALEGLSSTGIAVRTTTDTWAQRSLAAPAAGFTITNNDGVSGNPTFVLANDLSALEALASTGFAARTGSDAWAQRTLTAPAAGFTISNPAGVAGDPTFALANDLSALEALSSTGIAVRTASDTWAQRTITGTASEIAVTNGDGVSGNPTLSLPSTIALAAKVLTGGVFNSMTLGGAMTTQGNTAMGLGKVTAWQGGYVAARYYLANIGPINATTALAVNTVYYCPFNVGETHTFDRIAAQITTTGTATNIRLAIYNAAGGIPTSLVVDGGNVAAGSTGLKTVTISQSLTPGAYFLAIVADGTVTIQSSGSQSQPAYLYNGVTDLVTPDSQLNAALTFGAFPSTAGAVSYSFANTPALGLRA